MLHELLEITCTGEFEDNGTLALQSSTWRDDALELGFRVDHGTGVISFWTVQCSGVIEYALRDAHYQIGLNICESDHPVIDQHTESREGVYISKAPKSSDTVVGQLWAAHVRRVDDWISFDRYLNTEVLLQTLLESGNALIASAPAFLASAYLQVLESNRCAPSRVPAGPARASSARLVHFGDSYVVAARVTASRSAGY
ncbi:MAG: hypothetical protein WA208_01510 [Thermoanaerobaculia bacterium]